VMTMVLFSVFSIICLTFWLHDTTVLTADLRWDLECWEQEIERQTQTETRTGRRLLIAEGNAGMETEGAKAVCSWSGSASGIWTGKTLSYSETVKKTHTKPGKYLYTNRLLREE